MCCPAQSLQYYHYFICPLPDSQPVKLSQDLVLISDIKTPFDPVLDLLYHDLDPSDLGYTFPSTKTEQAMHFNVKHINNNNCCCSNYNCNLLITPVPSMQHSGESLSTLQNDNPYEAYNQAINKLQANASVTVQF
ncbi:hypothetical protein QOT17_025431 [Balamuthia mandrillaris]